MTETLSNKTFSDLVELGNKFGKVARDGDHYEISFTQSEGFKVLVKQILSENEHLINKDNTDMQNLEKLLNLGSDDSYNIKVID